ncbi:hypothetical protein ACR71G_14205 [Xenorhabdus bovienii]|uniref:hypothetical protein n=1 Tax=Xenorhabdus bovienii TaxID=40576 RepID=UPI003DA46F2E
MGSCSNERRVSCARNLFFTLGAIAYFACLGYSSFLFNENSFDKSAGIMLAGFIFLQMSFANFKKESVGYVVVSSLAQIITALFTIIIVYHKAKFGY